MPIYKGSSKIGVIKKGSTNFKRVCYDSTLVFGKKEVFEQTFTSSGSHTFPSTLLSLDIIVVGGGGGGGAGSTLSIRSRWAGGGGGGGAKAEVHLSGDALTDYNGKTFSFTVGAGGSEGA